MKLRIANYFIGLFWIITIPLLITRPSFGQSYIDRDSTFKEPRLYVSLGSYHPNMTTSLRIDSKIGLGTELSLEDDIKLESNMTVFRTDATIRVKKRSQFVVAFTSLQRDRELTLDEDVDFQDTTFYIDARVRAYFDLYYYSLTWRYSLYNEQNWNAGFSVGTRFVQIKTGVEASLNQNSYREDVQFTAPAILFGIHGAGYLRPRLLTRYSLEYLQLSIADMKIVAIENRFSIEYFIHKNVGLGAGYEVNSYRIKEIPLSDDFRGKVNLSFGGFNIFVAARF